MRVLVTGATGLVGSALCRALVQDGHSVVAQTRNARQAERRLFPGIELLEWNPAQQDFPVERMAGVDAVVHLLGEPIASARWTPEKRQAILDSRVVSTRKLVAAIAASPERPKVCVFASAVGYYGDGGNRELGEDAPAGKGFLAQVCVEWERASEDLNRLGVRRVVLRQGLVLSLRGGALSPMLPMFRHGLGAVLGNGKQWSSWIHETDLVRLIQFCLESPDLAGPVNAVAPNPVTQEEFAQGLAKSCGGGSWLRVPATMIKMAAGEAAEVVLFSQRVVPNRLKKVFQWEFPEFQSAIANVVTGEGS